LIFDGCGAKKACYARCFDLPRNSNLTVPMYADRFELFVFSAPLTSVRKVKKLSSAHSGLVASSSDTLLQS